MSDTETLARDINALTVAQMRRAIDVERDMPFAAPEVHLAEFKRRVAEGLPVGSSAAGPRAPSPAVLRRLVDAVDDAEFIRYQLIARPPEKLPADEIELKEAMAEARLALGGMSPVRAGSVAFHSADCALLAHWGFNGGALVRECCGVKCSCGGAASATPELK